MNSKTILLIDDDQALLKVLSTHLAKRGYNVVKADNGYDAVHTAKYCDVPIDIVIVDLIMRGMNGVDVLRNVKDYRPDTKVMILTAYGDLESAIEALRFRADDYLLKPVEISEIDYRIAQLFQTVVLSPRIKTAKSTL